MSMFETIKNAIFGHGAAGSTATASAASGSGPSAGATSAAGSGAPNPPTASSTSGSAPGMSQDALQAQLAQLSAKNAQKLNWESSIVDLMKLVGLDPSLANRKQLAQELGYKGDTSDSASMNIWLHKTVMDKLAASGGNVPADLKA